jgi:hypothetical protein
LRASDPFPRILLEKGTEEKESRSFPVTRITTPERLGVFEKPKTKRIARAASLEVSSVNLEYS